MGTAQKLFEEARKDLLNVDQWHVIAGNKTVFQLVSSNGEEIQGPVKKDDFIRIELPALPSSTTGEGYEWVRVEKLEEKRQEDFAYSIIQVRPASPPFVKTKEIAHFFSRDGTSSFCVIREGNKVTAAVYGRNEHPNTKTFRIIDRIRNIVVALGAMIGLNKPQWKSLVTGLLRKNVEE